MNLTLVSPLTDAAWKAYHDVRRSVLFEARHDGGSYDEDHPDERAENNYPKLLIHPELGAVGVVRIDIRNRVAFIRRAAVAQAQQRSGYGLQMMKLAEDFCRHRSVATLSAAVAPDAVEFYRRCGFKVAREQTSAKSIRMAKDI
ncbi:GNAT family N-acetyltransferase [Pararhizobium sp. LjRoot238]|uniref:GNAT family N-acetyltransferase n=1 Tax=Pararhizobium sp. LjRoot238 TaxID=3342293 RepID=UPI003F50071A